jgi:phosphate transport system permease protein
MKRHEARAYARLRAGGGPLVWVMGSGLALAIIMIVGLLALVVVNGTMTFWPKRLLSVELDGGRRLLGEVTRTESYRPEPEDLANLRPADAERLLGQSGLEHRRLLRTGNFDLYGNDFQWVADHEITEEATYPADAWFIERREWGPFVGYMKEIRIDGAAVASSPADVEARFHSLQPEARDRFARSATMEREEVGEINDAIEGLRLRLRGIELEHGKESEDYLTAEKASADQQRELEARYQRITEEIARLRTDDARYTVLLAEINGETKELDLSEIVRAYRPNAMSRWEQSRTYLGRWWEFLSDEPREANTEGGVLPAIFGTVVMILVMSLAVAPLGVIAALYMREYAKQGVALSAVRIAVNNLAGVPSIVFGVFGLGFFCYVIGGGIDALFFPERLPSPTYGTGGLLWASLTLALLTVPVVIVATEEALAAVPGSMREGSYGCGASKWQTIWRIVLPRALPGVMTGLILAMARGAGEVAPLMITGVVKLAPELPIDGDFPFVHLYRSFMHLGFHIFDVGFQSRNSEAGKPMVYTTTLLLLTLIGLLNLSAIQLRSRLKRRFAGSQF